MRVFSYFIYLQKTQINMFMKLNIIIYYTNNIRRLIDLYANFNIFSTNYNFLGTEIF